jgi:hypothetical protein
MESSEELVVEWFPLPWNRGGCKQGTCNAKQTMITYHTFTTMFRLSCGCGFIGSGSDPAFQVNPDPDPIRIQGFDDHKLKKKNTAEKFV